MLTIPDNTAIAATPHKSEIKICFYPSSGFERLWVVMALDCDVFIFSDKQRRPAPWPTIQHDFLRHGRDVVLVEKSDRHVFFASGGKAALLFLEDNNQTLARIQSDFGWVHHFVGICDGCCEGGNDECVHDRPFMSRLLQNAAPGMKYSTDHSQPLELRPVGWGGGVPSKTKFMPQVRWSEFPAPERRHRNTPWPDEPEKVDGNPLFRLQGVLVARDRQGYGPIAQADLSVREYSGEPTELMTLAPFRTLGHRGILAEYRVDNLKAPAQEPARPQALLAVKKARQMQRAHDLSPPVATASSWSNVLPMPELHKVLPMSVRFSEHNMHYIWHGFTPNDMSDKWFCYAPDPQTLRIHRSWTGHCIFELRFRASGCDEWELFELAVNRDPEQYTSKDDEGAQRLVFRLLTNHLLTARDGPLQFYPGRL